MVKQVFAVTETEPTALVKDFNTFVDFLSNNNTELAKSGNLPRKVVFQLNQLMTVQATGVTVNNDQDLYPLLHLFFHLALAGKLFGKRPGKADKLFLVPDARIQLFKELTDTEKYFFLLETFWVDIKWSKIYAGISPNYVEPSMVSRILQLLLQDNEIEQNGLQQNDYSSQLYYWGYFLLYFSYFGFWDVVKDEDQHKKAGMKKTFFPESIELTKFGKRILEILNTKRNVVIWNLPNRKNPEQEQLFDLFKIWRNTDIKNKGFEKAPAKQDEPFFLAFRTLFPKGELEKTLPRELPKFKDGVYTFKVSLAKNLWRKINLSAKHTLDDLHGMIQAAFDFDNDHLYAFYMDGKKWSDDAYMSPGDAEGPFADEMKIGDFDLNEGHQFLYLFDFGDEWTFQVLLEKIQPEEARLLKPIIVESKGESPAQYPEYEDEDDEDWEEDDD